MRSLPSASSLYRRRQIDKSNGKEINAMIGLLLVCLLLVLLFGGLGLVVSPMFFLLVVVLILAFGWGGFYRRGR